MKRLVCLLICFLLLSGIVTSVNVFADEAKSVATVYEKVEFNNDGSFEVSGEILYNGTVSGAVDYLVYGRRGGAVVLKSDVILDSGLTLQSVNDTTSYILIDGKVTLDLNGYSITQQAGTNYSVNPAIVVPKGSKLSLKDSSEKKNGMVNGVQYGIGINGGKLDFYDGSVKAQSQASFMPDDVEVPVRITNYGTLNLMGGKILYHGELDDGRTYFEKSCAVLADNTGKLTVSNGRIFGPVEVENTNFVATGGTFDFDVSNILSPLYKVEKIDESYMVKYAVPTIDTKDCNAVVKVVTDDSYITETIERFEIEVESVNESVSLDIKQLLDIVLTAEQNYIPEIWVNAGFVELVLDGETVEEIALEGKSDEVWLKIGKNKQIPSEIVEKMNNARYEISFEVTDEFDDAIVSECEAQMVVHHKFDSAINGVHMYCVEGSELKNKIYVLKGNDISCKVQNGEKLLVSEGIAMMITGRTLELRGTISIVFYAELIGVNHSDVKMLFWDSPQAEYTIETAQRSVSYSSKDEYGYKFEYKNVSAKDMNKPIYARLCVMNANGKMVYGTEPKSGYSVTTYAENMMKKNESVKPLLASMVNYGAAAQEYFGSDHEPANIILAPEERLIDYSKVYESTAQTIPEESRNGKSGSYVAGKTLILDGDISISYYVMPDEVADETGMLFWTENAFWGTTSHVLGTQSKRIAEYSTDSGYFVFNYEDIFSGQMFDNIYARVYTKKDGIYKYGDIEKYSVKDYVANQLSKSDNAELINLLRSLLIYGEEAKKFFG